MSTRSDTAASAGSNSDAASTAFPLGYYGANPNGNDPSAEQDFENQYNAFVQAMDGSRPLFMNAFVDFSVDPSEWGDNAGWTAWSWAQTGNGYVGPNSGTTPVIGVPMATNANGWGKVDQFYRDIISGRYDADYKAIVDAWASEGYTTLDLRLGYEFDGNFMAWAPGNSQNPHVNSDFVAAWQHLADLVHAEGKADGITVNTVWNPDDISWSVDSVASLYPGDQYVDIISSDAYSPVYPTDLTDWASGGTTQDATIQQWAAQPADREHYWQYTDANYNNPTGDGSGWSFQDAVDFAKAHGKPIALSETGAGGDATTTGPVDDPAFPQWLAGALDQAQAQGVPVSYVDIWDAPLGDGDWDFSDPGSDKPLEKAAWDKYFGAGSGSSDGSGGGSGGSDGSGGGSGGSDGSGGGSGGSGGASNGGTSDPETIFAQAPGSLYYGGTNPMSFVAGDQADSTVVAGQGNAVMSGGNADSLFFVGSGQFMLDGGSGSQTVVGASGVSNSAVLYSENGGSLTLLGDSGGNVLVAGTGNVTLNGAGASGTDVFVAGSGEDSLTAGAGNDVIFAGSGSATMTGGAGADLFLVGHAFAAGGNELIGNWNANDQLYLSGYGASVGSDGLPAGAASTVVNGSEVLTLPDGTRVTFSGVASVNPAQLHTS